jgi:hypothetical protein
MLVEHAALGAPFLLEASMDTHLGLRAIGAAVATLAACSCGSTPSAEGPADAGSDDAAAADARAVDDASLDAPPAPPDAGGPDDAAPPPPSPCTADGFCWVSPSPPAARFAAAWGAGPNEVWAVGESGTVVRWDGGRWSLVDAGVTDDLFSVAGVNGHEVWVAGGKHARRWDGSSWSSFDSGLDAFLYGLDAIWGAAPDDVWGIMSAPVAGILHYDGHVWSKAYDTIPENGGLTQIWGTAANDIWVVGRGNVVHFDGTSWTQQIPTLGASWVTGVYATSTQDAWLSDGISVFRWSGTARTDYPSVQAQGLFGANANAVFAFGSDYSQPTVAHVVARWNGAAWTMVPHPADLVRAMWGSDDHGVWAFGDGILGKYDGAGWNPPAADDVHAVFAVAPNDVWALLDAGRAEHWDGAAWTSSVIDPAGGALAGLWGASSIDLWAVGAGGAAWRFDGHAWTKWPTNTAASLVAVHGAASSAVFAAGADGTFARWDGHAWTATKTAATKLDDVWAAGPTDIWLVGAQGNSDFAVRGDGTTFTPVGQSGFGEYKSVTGTSSNDVWIDGDHFDGHAWTSMAPQSGVTAATAFAPNDVWAIDAYGHLNHWDGNAWTRTATRSSLIQGIAGSAHDVWVFGSRGTLLRRMQ